MSIKKTMFQMLDEVEEKRAILYIDIIDHLENKVNDTLKDVGADKHDRKACLKGLVIRINNKLKELE